MKKLFILLFLFIVYNCNSQNNYITYIKGKDPIVLIATHGGSQYTTKITNRDCGKHTCVTDLHTDRLLKESVTYFKSVNIYPHILIMELEREEIDLNRKLEEACNDLNCNIIYKQFHSKIDKIIRSYNKKVLILDIHGHSHRHALIELGYDIKRKDYYKNLNFVSSSIDNISNNNEEYIRGYKSMGFLFELFDYPTTPSNRNTIPPVKYFNGGYITERYKQYNNTAVIQIELPFYIRKNKKERAKFLNTFTKIVSYYYDTLVVKK